MKAKKSLGQHFLTSEGAVDSILDAADIAGDDIVLEIGPGKGVLTGKLLEDSQQVLAVEKDDSLYEFLKQKFESDVSSGKLILIHEDILELDLSKLTAKSYKLVANIPYNITGQIIRKFLEASFQPERMVLMVQKEVAERIVARRHGVSTEKGEGKESILSISVKAYGDPKYIQTVKAGSFFPIPNVDSAILLVENISKEFFQSFTEEDFFKIVHAGFRSKRKKLSSNLSEMADKTKVFQAFNKLHLDPNLRAEDAPLSTWKKLAEEILN